MIEDETATGEGMPEPRARRPRRPATPTTEESVPQQPDTVTLTVVGPSWSTGIRLVREDGSTLFVTRKGADVPADQAQALINIAAKNGVTLRSN